LDRQPDQGRLSASYHGGGVIYRAARAEDNADLVVAMQDNPMQGWVRLSLIRDPDGGAGKELMGEGRTYVAREEVPPHALVGMYSYACMPVHLNGNPDHLGYLGALRVNPAYRHRLRVVKHGFSSLNVLVQPCAGRRFSFTAVASQNSRARRLLEAGLSGMPVYEPYGEIETLAVSTGRGKTLGLLRRATTNDVHSIVEFYNGRAAGFQFAPVLTADWLLGNAARNGLALNDFWLLERNARLVGCLAIWDQRAFKRTLIHGYRFPLDITRIPYNAWAGLTRRPKLPQPGKTLDEVFLAFVAFATEAGNLAIDAIREGLDRAREKGASVAVLALATGHPLRREIHHALRPHAYCSMIETVRWPSDPIPVLDGRPAQPEVAIL
jgi:hypothetical protein